MSEILVGAHYVHDAFVPLKMRSAGALIAHKVRSNGLRRT